MEPASLMANLEIRKSLCLLRKAYLLHIVDVYVVMTRLTIQSTLQFRWQIAPSDALRPANDRIDK